MRAVVLEQEVYGNKYRFKLGVDVSRNIYAFPYTFLLYALFLTTNCKKNCKDIPLATNFLLLL